MSAATPISASVLVLRPRLEVFGWYRDLTHLPQFLGDVTEVRAETAHRYRWTVSGPLGLPVHWTVEVVEERPGELLRYRTVPLHGVSGEWIVRFANGAPARSTVVTEEMRLPAQGWTESLLGLVGKPPRAELAANLQRLKERLETGRVTTLAHSTPGKFPG